MLDIVIVNWNSGDFLRNCIVSVFAENGADRINKLYIIDNNTTDGSLDNIPINEKIVIIRNQVNKGFSKACNQGFSLCTAPYILLLNPDTKLFANTLQDCLDFMNTNETVDVLGCQLLDDEGDICKSCARFPTPLKIFFDASGLSKIAPHIFNPATLMTDWNHTESRYVDQVIGAFMFMRSSVFKTNGYFDERFFVYYEELDFSKRLREAGGKSYFNAGIRAIHSENGTTRSIKGFRLFLYLRSRLQYAKKHFSYPGYALVWLSTFIIEPFSRTILLLVKGRFKEIRDVYKGYTLLLKDLPIR